ncbi:MAG: PEP-CTERM sorting domain-containing protein [Herminiimonas sp.]|nr:PEP-CTERM sorting domain-containing protein [Herminiimonas sp.]
MDNQRVPGHAYRLLYSIGQGTNEANAGNSTASSRVTLTAIPEPGAVALLTAGLMAMFAICRKRFKRHTTSTA